VIERALEVEAKLHSLRAIGLWLHEAARDGGLPYEAVFGLDLAVHEAVENVVRHGAGKERGAHASIRLRLRADSRRVEVVVEDDGQAFDPLSAPAPAAPRRIEDVVPGGQGIHLMRMFTDEIHYRREEGRNVLTLVRALPPRGEGA
jgi:anti-sigma regulatory factor (Ser/Thr protein kinase)